MKLTDRLKSVWTAATAPLSQVDSMTRLDAKALAAAKRGDLQLWPNYRNEQLDRKSVV